MNPPQAGNESRFVNDYTGITAVPNTMLEEHLDNDGPRLWLYCCDGDIEPGMELLR